MDYVVGAKNLAAGGHKVGMAGDSKAGGVVVVV